MEHVHLAYLASGLQAAARCRMSNHPLTGDPKSSLSFLASSEIPTPSLMQSASPKRAWRFVGSDLINEMTSKIHYEMSYLLSGLNCFNW